MTDEVLRLYKDVEDSKLSLIMSIGDKKISAASCPTFGNEYRAMMVVTLSDGSRYRYDLFSGKQIIIEEEYSPIPTKDLRQIESVLATSYIGNASKNIHTFYECMLYTIDALNANTKDWESVLNDKDYKEIPKFSNRRKPTKKASN